jgi:hypothetical protein
MKIKIKIKNKTIGGGNATLEYGAGRFQSHSEAEEEGKQWRSATYSVVSCCGTPYFVVFEL